MKTSKITTKLLLSPDNDPSMAQPPNWKNQTVLIDDNIDTMRAMNSQTTDLIATDPPFNKHKKFDHIFGGKKEFGFDDAWTLHAERNEDHKLLESDHNDLYEVYKIGGKLHSKGMLEYLVFMGVRLIECKRILRQTGSIYLHCDHSANVYLRLLMNGVFGEETSAMKLFGTTKINCETSANVFGKMRRTQSSTTQKLQTILSIRLTKN